MSTNKGLFSKGLAALAVLGVSWLGAGALAPASAAEVDVVTGVTIENTTHSEGTYEWDQLKLNFTVDTTDKGVKAGDTFTIKVDDKLLTGVSEFVFVTEDGSTTVAQCSIPGGWGQTLTCEFGDYVNTHPDLTGHGWLLSQVGEDMSENSFKFSTTNKTYAVPVPGGEVLPEPGRVVPTNVAKEGWIVSNVDPGLLHWGIQINAKAFQGTVTVVDTFDTSHGGYSLSSRPGYEPVLKVWSSRAAFENHEDEVIVPVGGAINGGTFTFTPTATGFEASWPSSPSVEVYELVFYADANDITQAKPGESFNNSAEVNGTTATARAWINARGAGVLDGPGYGHVEVLKAPLEGSGAGYVDANMAYTVKASYEFRGQARTDEIELTAGGPAKALPSLPKGTVVELSEIAPAGGGLTWGTPVFSSDSEGVEISPDGSSAKVTIGDQVTTRIVVTNKVEAPEPKIDIVKKDSDGNDANTADEAVDLTAKNGATDLVFTITNDGIEDLKDIAVTDVVTAGKAKVEGLTCTFPDGSKGTTWAGVFAVGASFTCEAKLSGVVVDNPHTDIATVVGTGVVTGKNVTDEDAYNAKVTAKPVTPPTEKPKKELPKTGANVGVLAVLASLAVLTGTGAVVARRKMS